MPFYYSNVFTPCKCLKYNYNLHFRTKNNIPLTYIRTHSRARFICGGQFYSRRKKIEFCPGNKHKAKGFRQPNYADEGRHKCFHTNFGRDDKLCDRSKISILVGGPTASASFSQINWGINFKSLITAPYSFCRADLPRTEMFLVFLSADLWDCLL